MLTKKYVEKHLEAITTDTKMFFSSSDEEIREAVEKLEKEWRKPPKEIKVNHEKEISEMAEEEMQEGSDPYYDPDYFHVLKMVYEGDL